MESENKDTPKVRKRLPRLADPSNLSNDELLENLANSPCANRHVPPQQSLEDYLQSTKGTVRKKKAPSTNQDSAHND